MGTVFRRHYRDAHGNRRECATWTVRLCRDGQRIELPSGTTKRGEALTTLKLLEGDAARGIPVTATGQKLTVDHAMAEVIADYRQNGRRTVGDLEQRWTGHLRPWFGGRKIACLTTACVRAYIMARLETGAKPATVNRELAVLRRGFSLAVKDGRIMHKPFVPTLAEHNTRVGFFDREQFEAVRRHLAEPLRPVVTFGFLTGWRVPSEVLTLRWAQVDFGAGTVRLNPGSTKNGDGRTLVFSDMPEMIALLKTQRVLTDAVQQRQRRIVPFVFHRDGAPIKDFRAAWASACRAAGCPGRLVHDLRRTAVRNLVRAGVSEKTAMSITGHKTRSVFDRYNIVTEDDLREAGRRLAEHAAGQ